MFCTLSGFSQDDYQWWNTTHGWKEGMRGWRLWLNISPGYLGPNALPVPELKNGIIPEKSEVEFGADFHFKTGDPTQDLSGRITLPFAKGKIALELYGVIIEKYQMSETIRDERFARDKDGKGIVQGDLYFSTLIQLSKDRKFPNTLLRLTGKTASGGAYNAARYSDSPGYFFDLSFSKKITLSAESNLLPHLAFGFYSWQTTDELNLQNDALMMGAGIDFNIQSVTITPSVSGYAGYKNERDQPFVFNLGLKKNMGDKTLRLQYIKGIHNWDYTTLKVSAIWHFKGVN